MPTDPLMSNIKNIDDFNKIKLFKGETAAQDGLTLQPEIGEFGGRVFKFADGTEVKFKELIKHLKKLSKTELAESKKPEEVKEKINNAIKKLEDINTAGKELLDSKETSQTQRVLTSVRSFFGNLGQPSHKTALKNLKEKYKPSPLPKHPPTKTPIQPVKIFDGTPSKEQLSQHIEKMNADSAKDLLSQTDNEGNTLLHYAHVWNPDTLQSKFVNLLTVEERFAALCKPNADGITPLNGFTPQDYKLLFTGLSEEQITEVLDKGENRFNRHPFRKFSDQLEADHLKALLDVITVDQVMHFSKTRDSVGITPIYSMFSLNRNPTPVIKEWLNKISLDQNVAEILATPDKDGTNALHRLIHRGFGDALELVLSRIPDGHPILEAKDEYGQTPLDIAQKTEKKSGGKALSLIIQEKLDKANQAPIQ